MNVTIQCWNQEYRCTIFLHKDGHSVPIQHHVTDGGGTATFTIFGVIPADSDAYRCSYQPRSSYLLTSPPADNVTLEVNSEPAPPGGSEPPFPCPWCLSLLAVSLHPILVEVMAGDGDTHTAGPRR